MVHNASEVQRLVTIQRDTEEIRIGIDEIEGGRGSRNRYLSIRKWYTKSDGTFGPTKQGITIRFSELAEVRATLDKALEWVGEFGPDSKK